MSLGYLFTLSELVPHDAGRAALGFEKACRGGNADRCAIIADMYQDGVGVTADVARATRFRARACQLGLAAACAPSP